MKTVRLSDEFYKLLRDKSEKFHISIHEATEKLYQDLVSGKLHYD